jgi:hypothetical protein
MLALDRENWASKYGGLVWIEESGGNLASGKCASSIKMMTTAQSMLIGCVSKYLQQTVWFKQTLYRSLHITERKTLLILKKAFKKHVSSNVLQARRDTTVPLTSLSSLQPFPFTFPNIIRILIPALFQPVCFCIVDTYPTRVFAARWIFLCGGRGGTFDPRWKYTYRRHHRMEKWNRTPHNITLMTGRMNCENWFASVANLCPLFLLALWKNLGSVVKIWNYCNLKFLFPYQKNMHRKYENLWHLSAFYWVHISVNRKMFTKKQYIIRKKFRQHFICKKINCDKYNL